MEEDAILRAQHSLYADFLDEDNIYPEEDYDPYAEAEAIWESMNER